MLFRNEIGSEFWDIPTTNKENNIFPESTKWYLSGRSALQAVLSELSWARTAALPSWCCHTMVKPFQDAGIAVKFYPVYFDKNENKLKQEIDTSCDILLLMDYFGYGDSVTTKHACIIRDLTHSIFSKQHVDAAYYFGSLRKWCGVWTGGYAWAEDGHALNIKKSSDSRYAGLRERAMQLKNSYIHGYADPKGKEVSDKGYLDIFADAENLLEDAGMNAAAGRDIAVAKRLDTDFIKVRRRENARILMEQFPDWLIFKELGDDDCPLFVPVLVPNGKRDALRKYLTARRIYLPVHWPISSYHRLDERERFLYDNELSLVCDQRYTKEDMDWMVEMINSYWRDN